MRAIITVIGCDTVGIIAKVSSFLADMNVNILDISQTIMGEMFTMIMMVDAKNSNKPIQELSDGLSSVGKELGMEIKIQKEELFQSMHRI